MSEDETYEMCAEPSSAVPPDEFLSIFTAFDSNIDGDILERAWRTYDATQQQVLLEGDTRAWMVCSFYTSVWQATPLGHDPPYLYSLTQLLKLCNLSVLEFFDKLNKWVEMISGPRRLQEHVNRVQATLAVSTVIYKKYLPIVRSMFRIHTADSNDPDELTTSKLFEYIWVTYLTLKKLLPSGLEDLLNSYHILLCIIVLIADELQAIKSAILNPDFVQQLYVVCNILCENSSSSLSVEVFKESASRNTLEFLCQQFDGVELDARHLLTHWVMPKLHEFQQQNIITSMDDAAGEVSLLQYWTYNLAELNIQYEQQMMRRAEVDERMFVLHVLEDVDTAFNQQFDDSAITILKRGNLESNWAVDADLLLRVSTQRCMEKVQLTVKPLNTPLTARSYIISSEQFCPATPVSAASQRAQRLHELFVGESEEALAEAAEFDRLLAQCRDNPKLFIGNRIDTFEQMIERRVEDERLLMGANYDTASSCQLRQRLDNVELLYQRLLQKTVMYDRQRNPRAEVADLSAILHKADFITGLYICALEIVLMTYNSEREFPWSVETLQMPPINFYKVIEIVVRSEPELSRDMVKHLNRCEERVLEELAWAPASPLWDWLARHTNGVPSCSLMMSESGGPTMSAGSSRPAVSSAGATVVPSTINVRYAQSPMRPFDRTSVKRRVESGDEELVPSKKPTDESGFLMPSGTNLFFRKIYYLAAVRLNDLCDRLRVEEMARSRVWTLFEHMLRTETALTLGRHIDQNLMCCIYITAKISGLDLSFHRIMSSYRQQPQASSRIYRQVLAGVVTAVATTAAAGGMIVDDGTSRDSISNHGVPKLRSGSAVPQPGIASSPATPEPSSQGALAKHSAATPATHVEYIDLIMYYNRVFVPRVEDFVKQLHPTNSDTKENMATITAMPRIACTTLLPRRMIGSQLCIMPMSAATHAPRRATSRAGGSVSAPTSAIKTEASTLTVGPATVIRRRVY